MLDPARARAARIEGRRVRGLALVVALVGLLTAPFLVPSASAATPEWNLQRINAPSTAGGIIIAVVDSGVDAGHTVFAGRVLPAIDLVGDGKSGDPNGHGTHVAGTAAGADAGCGNIGVAPDAKILPVRVLDEEGSGNSGTVAEGIRAAADAGAHVINLSLGSDVVLRNVAGSGLDSAIAYAFDKGSIPVLAAGNDGFVGAVFGSGYGSIKAVVVTATDNQDRAASYATSIGSAKWGVAAPGGDASGKAGRDVMSAFPGGQCALSAGTSMAAPAVSGALAALRARGLAPQAAIDRLLATTKDLGSPDTYGAGLIDVAAATKGLGTGPTPTQPPTTPPPTTAPPTTQPSVTQPPASTPATTRPAPAAPPATTAPPVTAAGAASASSTTTATSLDDPEVAASGDLGAPSSTATSVVSPVDDAVDESAQAVINDEGDDGLPTAVVLVAVGGLLVAATGAASMYRRSS